MSEVGERYALIDRATKLKFELVFTLPRFLTVNDPKLKDQFIDAMNSRAPSWRIEGVAFKCEYKRGQGNAHLYTVETELNIWPRVEKPKPLIVALYEFDVPPSVFLAPETSILAKVVESTFMSPPHTVVWTNVSIETLVSPSPTPGPSPTPVVETVVLKENSLVTFAIKGGKRKTELTEKEVQEKKKDIEKRLNKEMQENVYGWKAEVRNINFSLERKEGEYYVYSGTMDVAFIKTDPEGPDLIIQSQGVGGWIGILAALALIIALTFFVGQVILLVKEVKPLLPSNPSDVSAFWFILLLLGILTAAGIFLGGLGRAMGN